MPFDLSPTDRAFGDKALADIQQAIGASNYDEASAIADACLKRGIEHPVFFNARGLAFRTKGRFREALTEFSRARALAPADPRILNAIGLCLSMLNLPQDALRIYDEAISVDPNNAEAHFHKGWILEMLGDNDKACAEYEGAIAIRPDHAEALGSIAGMRAHQGKYEEARTFAERALKANPRQPTATVALGIDDIAKKDFASAEARFRRVLENPGLTMRARAGVHGLLADALDGLDRVDEAFAAYKFEKNEIYKLYAPNYLGQQRPDEIAERIAAYVESQPAEVWKSLPSEDPGGLRPRRHAFLLGFSRSGTTLLEQVLASHPDVVALEENDVLAAPAQSYLMSEAGLRQLTSPGAAGELARHRRGYWQRVRELGLDVEGKVFVDKLPLNTVKLPLIRLMFPDAKILFALRDPRDVVLSCYRRHFEINVAMFEFLTLEDTVEFYGAVMNLGTLCFEKMPFDKFEHRYEDMVADFDTRIRLVCEFIGVEWSDALREFHANKVLPVRSPSARQIQRPLYEDSVAQWRRYRKHLAPVLPLLRPWVERFGYPAD